ncbi:MAG: hypothetical protein ACI9U2_001356 [Bradymonadia bacterium]|jgi:hypothetical protein
MRTHLRYCAPLHALSVVAICLSTALMVSCEGTAADGSNRGAACQTAAYAKCERPLTCNLAFTDTDLCADLLVRQCCANSETCDDTLSADMATQFAQCTSALRVQVCEDAASTPAACMGLSAGL